MIESLEDHPDPSSEHWDDGSEQYRTRRDLMINLEAQRHERSNKLLIISTLEEGMCSF